MFDDANEDGSTQNPRMLGFFLLIFGQEENKKTPRNILSSSPEPTASMYADRTNAGIHEKCIQVKINAWK